MSTEFGKVGTEYGVPVGAWDNWKVTASSGEYNVPAETLGHALLRFMARHPDDSVHSIAVDMSIGGKYNGDTVWLALDKYGFDPAYQEVMVTAADTNGEHWSYTPQRHVHLTFTEDQMFVLREAGSECPHDEKGDDKS